MRAFVQTRGTARATDYAFLGGAPPEPWWRAYRAPEGRVLKTLRSQKVKDD